MSKNYSRHRHKPMEVLLVEDNPADARLTLEYLKDFSTVNKVSIVSDGVEAMAFLRREGKYCDVARPDLVLLDLNLPKKDGREVLAEIKGDSSLRRIPVVVLTTSTAEQDIHRSYDLHANCYVSKPLKLEEYSDVVRSIEDFWLTVAKLPA